MPLDLAGASVVVVAHQFNPSVIGELWLARHGFLGDNEREPGCVFTDAIVNVRSPLFNLLVTPDQLQFVPRVAEEMQRDLILEKLGRIIDLLPHVPYHAVGLNFVWVLNPEPESVAVATRRLFFIQDRPLFRQFDTDDAQFGTYLSKDFLGCRLKLDIKPVVTTAVNENEMRMSHVVNLAFNFHADVVTESDRPARIRQMLAQWDEVKEEAERIAQDVKAL